MKFLVVDDSRHDASHRHQFAPAHRVLELPSRRSDGLEALEQVRRVVGFVITDWNMPNMSGTRLRRALRARTDRPKTVPILMVTTRSVREDILAAVEAGVNNYIVKPFTPPVLKEKIDSRSWPPRAQLTMTTPRSAEELLYDSAATLRLVDNVLDALREFTDGVQVNIAPPRRGSRRRPPRWIRS